MHSAVVVKGLPEHRLLGATTTSQTSAEGGNVTLETPHVRVLKHTKLVSVYRVLWHSKDIIKRTAIEAGI